MEISHKMAIIFLFFTVLLIPHIGKAYVKSHPLSEIHPINTSLNMSNNTGGISYNVTNIGWINPSLPLSIGSQLNLKDNLSMGGNSINSVGNLVLGWENLTNYPTGCNPGKAVQVIGDNLECVPLDSGGVVNTTGGDKNEIAFFINNTTVSSDSNLYWEDSSNRLGIGTSTPEYTLDVGGGMGVGGSLNIRGNDIINTGLVNGTDLDNPGTGISLEGNRYVADLGISISTDELNNYNVTNSKIALDSVNSSQVSFNYAGSSSKGGAAFDVSCDECINDSEVDNDITIGDGGSVNNSALPPTISVTDLRALNSLKVSGGYTQDGLTVDSQGNIMTSGNLSYSGQTFVINKMELNDSAEFPFGIFGGEIYPGDLNSVQKNVYMTSDGSVLTINNGSLDMSGNDIINVNNYNLVQNDIPPLTTDWNNNIDAAVLANLSALDNKIELMEQNITNENWVDEAGDEMSGQLNMTNDIDLTGHSIKSSDGEICIGNQCN